MKRPLSPQPDPAEAAWVSLLLSSPTSRGRGPLRHSTREKGRLVLLTAQHMPEAKQHGEAGCMGRGCMLWAESSEALALNVRGHLESVPDKEKRWARLPSEAGYSVRRTSRFWGRVLD